jgi:hypothetical protein
MRPWLALCAPLAGAALVAVVFVALRAGRSDPDASAPPPAFPAPAANAASLPKGAVENCRSRSEGDFYKPFVGRSNVVVGPLVVVGGAEFTPPSVVRSVGGQKYPILVRADHTVHIVVPREARSFARLGYGPLPQGEITLNEAHEAVTFIACPADQPSYSNPPKTVGATTFWSGFVVTDEPHCVPLDVYVDGDPRPWRIVLEQGVRPCPGAGAAV